MGILESFKRVFNISGAQVEVTLEDEVYSQNDSLSGQVVIKGGELEQSGDAVRLRLMEFWQETRYDAATKTTTTVTKFRTHDTQALAGAFTVKPHSEERYSFKARLPLNARITTAHTGWRLYVSLDIPGAIDPKGFVPLQVEPAEELLAVVETCETVMRFEESKRHRAWIAKTHETRFQLIPPQVLRKELDYFRLELLQTDDGGVRGSLVFDLQEKSIGDYFKALFNRDKVSVPLMLSRADLLLPDGSVHHDEIVAKIGSVLKKIIADRQG